MGGRRIHVEGSPEQWKDGPRSTPASGGQSSNVAESPNRPGTPSGSGHGVGVSPAALIEHERRIGKAIDDVRVRVASLLGRTSAAGPALAELSHGLSERHAATVASTSAAAKQQTAQRLTEAQQRVTTSRTDALHAAAESLAALAPGLWGRPWPDEVSLDEVGTVPAGWVRVGGFQDAQLDGIPALLPMADVGGWLIRGDAEQSRAVLLNVVARVIAHTPPKHLALHVFDPLVRGSLGVLAPLRSVEGSAFPPPAQVAGDFTDRLSTVIASAARNAEAVVSGGYRSFMNLWRERAVPEGVVNVVVVLDFPTGVDEDLLTRLSALSSINGSSGTILLVQSERSLPADSAAGRWASGLMQVVEGKDGWSCTGLPKGAVVVPDPPLLPTQISRLVSSVAEVSAQQQGPVVALEELLAASLEAPWMESAAESLDAVIGVAQQQLLTVSLRTENPPHPNLLVGGAVGQGKSNLLLDIIYSLAVRYSPAEMELLLLDFKRGLEFNRFAADDDGENWLPHVRALSLESNQDFGLAVLAHVEAEMTHRSELFKQVGASSLDAYRRLSGQPLPRMLLIVDEFHVIFEGEANGVERAVELLGLLAKQGRAYGIHLLLASQTTSGISALATKGDGIFAQFPLRMSLKNTSAESQAILAQGNTGAVDLTYRGEVIVNRNFGNDPAGSNVRGLAAYVAPEVFREVQKRLWRLGHGDAPLTFVASAAAPWDDAAFTAHREEAGPSDRLRLWLGQPIALRREPQVLELTDDIDQTVAVVGPGESVARMALGALMVTALHQLRDGGRLVVLDGSEETSQAWFAEVGEYAAQLNVPVDVVPREGIAAYLLDQVAPVLDAGVPGAPTLLIGIALQRARGMDQAAALASDDDDFSYVEPVTPRSVLQRLAKDGGLVGMPLIGWWSNLRGLENDLGPGAPGVGRFVTAELGLEDLRTIAGPHVTRPQGGPRLGLLDRNGDAGLVVLVPFSQFTSMGSEQGGAR